MTQHVTSIAQLVSSDQTDVAVSRYGVAEVEAAMMEAMLDIYTLPSVAVVNGVTLFGHDWSCRFVRRCLATEDALSSRRHVVESCLSRCAKLAESKQEEVAALIEECMNASTSWDELGGFRAMLLLLLVIRLNQLNNARVRRRVQEFLSPEYPDSLRSSAAQCALLMVDPGIQNVRRSILLSDGELLSMCDDLRRSLTR